MYRFAILGLILGMIATGSGAESPTPREVDVAALVRQLGSPNFKEREAAGEKLASLAVDEPPAELLAALKSSNPEVRERAARAVKAIRAAATLRRLPREERFATRGQVDLYVASTAALKLKPEDERLWVPGLKLGSIAVAKAEMVRDRKPQGNPTWFGDFPTYRSKLNPEFVRTDGAYTRPKEDVTGKLICAYQVAVQAAEVKADYALAGLVVSRGSVRAETNITQSLILSTGDVTTEKGIYSSVVICDGDVVIGRVDRCLIITRGKIEVQGAAFRSTLIAGQTVTVSQLPLLQTDPIPEGTDPAIVKAKLGMREAVKVEMKENDSNPLGFITFFELHRIGLEVKAAEGEVRVAKVAAGGASAKAGLKVGDVLLEANGKKPSDAESLRRLLRDALAIGDATVKLKRGDRTETVKISLPE